MLIYTVSQKKTEQNCGCEIYSTYNRTYYYVDGKIAEIESYIHFSHHLTHVTALPC